MNSVPLIQKVDKDSINTTIIALKKAINEIESVLGLDSGSEIDTSVFVKKSEVVDAVEADNLSPVTSNAVADYVVDRIEVNESRPASSNAVAEVLSYSTEEKVVGTWIDGKTLYEKTIILRVPSNGNYFVSIASGCNAKDWRGNFFQGSIDNPQWVMHIPYSYLEGTPVQNWIQIYVYAHSTGLNCAFLGGGQYAPQYFDGYAVFFVKYTKD